jgi:hypothetical protein
MEGESPLYIWRWLMPDLGTVVVVEETFNKIQKVKFAWTSEDVGADAGKATKTTTNAYTGEIIRLVTIPGGAPNAPSDNYTVTVTDEDSTDVLMGAAFANRDEANTEQVLASSLGCVANDKLTLNVSGAGNAKTGTVIIYIK